MAFTRVVARLLMSGIFLLSGISKLQDFNKFVGYVGYGFGNAGITALLAKNGVDVTPLLPVALGITLALQILGAVFLIFGKEKLGASFLLAFLLAVTPVMHNPVASGTFNEGEFINLMKNVALAGGMLYVITKPCSKAPIQAEAEKKKADKPKAQ